MANRKERLKLFLSTEKRGGSRRKAIRKKKVVKKKEPETIFDKNIKNVFNNLPPEEKAKYKRAGEHMYNTDVYENSIDSQLKDAYDYLTSCINSGYSVNDLTEDDIRVMEQVGGKNWKDKF